MTRSITYEGVELLGWPSTICRGCFFITTTMDCPERPFAPKYNCAETPTVIWLTKEEWLKRRIKE